jgi:vitamin B12 transporter
MRNVTGAIAMVSAACALHAVGAEIQELPDVVVTPGGYEMNAADMGHSITVIRSAEIRAAGWRTLPEALRSVPGLYVSQSGAPGSTVSLSMRGSRSAQVLVLVDGVRLNDPSGPTREAEIQSIDLANVERIEVVRGPLSGLYGSDATAGVIQVITRRAESGVSGRVFVEGGSYQTYRAGGQLLSGTESTQVAVDAVYLQSDGFSAANERLEGNAQADGVETLHVRLRADHQFSESIRLDTDLMYIETQADYDNGAGPFADAENRASVEQILAGIGAHFGKEEAMWRQAIRLQYSRFDRSFEDMFGATTFDGEQMGADWRHSLKLGPTHQITFGISAQEESARSSGEKVGDAQTLSAYVQDYIAVDQFALLTGVRYDDHDAFGGAATWRLAPSYRIEKTATRVKGSIGTGYKAPSLYQLYAPESFFGPIGNADLDPERSLGWDFGFEQTLLDGLMAVDVTYFNNRIKDQIDFVVGYQNVSRVETEGVEVSARVSPSDVLDLTLSYTYTSAEDKTSGERLIRVPQDRGALRADWRPTGKINLSSTVRYVGSFDDRYFDMSMFAVVDTKVDASVVVDVAGSYDLSDRVQVYGRIDNLFDENYEEIAGYGTAGLSAYGGVRIQL